MQRGLYDSPKVNASLGGALSPDIDESARALARRYRWKIVPDGAWAANLLGLSTQVPAKIVYLSDGPNKKITLGRRTIQLKHARPQSFSTESGKSTLVIQALRYLGKDHVDDSVIIRLRGILTQPERRQLIKATRFGTDWIYAAAKKVTEESL